MALDNSQAIARVEDLLARLRAGEIYQIWGDEGVLNYGYRGQTPGRWWRFCFAEVLPESVGVVKKGAGTDGEEDWTSEDYMQVVMAQAEVLVQRAETQRLDPEIIVGILRLLVSYRKLAKAYEDLYYSSY